ncbi:phosphohistidine phosphatase [Hasllibacter halocynthiae]|uniref:Phosphohistidine phosphatase n=1 Tax=Hasllibacter halocynthiae TaxID=595589 RepID=A0A2T0X3M7_9RHOB|nr:histidine phosphatase family protein [Hasllibacter halocynthiae]PRY93517.1 phosphohistidine phosphatase [Hasllibacter halocynthiae]
MSRTLILIRHAKSDRAATGPDHNRPLAQRGRRQAPLMGAWLAGNGWVPGRALVSTAARAAETWGRIAPALGKPPRTDLEALYHAPPQAILDALAGSPEEAVAVVAHNPGLAELAARLVRAAPDHPRFQDFPTAATLAVRFDAPAWSGALRGTGEVLGFAVPADLEQGIGPAGEARRGDQ